MLRGVSRTTFWRWMKENRCQLARLGVSPKTKLLPPRAVEWICMNTVSICSCDKNDTCDSHKVSQRDRGTNAAKMQKTPIPSQNLDFPRLCLR